MAEIYITGLEGVGRNKVLADDEAEAHSIAGQMCPGCPVSSCSKMSTGTGMADLNVQFANLQATVDQAACKPTYTPR